MEATLLTIGHGVSDRVELGGRLQAAGVRALVDVRRFPGSRRNRDVGRDELASWLPAAGISYRWEERLGGRRSDPAGDADGWWQVASFRAYAAHARTEPFHVAMTELVTQAEAGGIVIMCSELLWWRCHRRLIADWAVLVHGLAVEHVMPDGGLQAHRPSGGAELSDGALRYPARAPHADAAGPH